MELLPPLVQNSWERSRSAYPAIEGVQQGVSGPVCDTAAAVGLASFAILQTLTTESPLVDLAVLCAAEWHAEILQLAHRHSHHEHVDVCILGIYSYL